MMMFLEYRVSMVFMLIYMLAFLSLKYSVIKTTLIAAGSFLLTDIIEATTMLGDFPTELNMFLLIIEIIIVQLTAVWLSSYRDMRSVFTGITASTYVLPGNILYMGVAALYKTDPPFWLLLLPIGVHMIILLVTVHLLRDKYLEEMEKSSRLWNELWIVPAFFYAITYMLTMWSDSFFKKWQNWAAIFLILILMDVIFIFIIRMISALHDEEEIKNGRELLEIYASGLEGQTEELKKMEEQFRILRHDNKYRYQMIRNCLNEGKLDQIQKLLDQTDEEFQAVTRRKFCKDVVVDGAVGVYYERAKEYQIEFKADIQMPVKTEKLNEFEFATVVMNLLDNAVRSAARVENQKERQVLIKIKPVKSQILLEVSNTFVENSYKISKVTGLPLSDRGTEHGFGMKSIKAYAEKHHGLFQYSVENGKFCVRLITEV